MHLAVAEAKRVLHAEHKATRAQEEHAQEHARQQEQGVQKAAQELAEKRALRDEVTATQF